MGLLIWIAMAILAWVVIPMYQERQRAERRRRLENAVKSGLLDGIAGMLAKIAKADGHISEEEGEVARRFLKSMGLSEQDYQYCVKRFNSARNDGYDIDHYASLFAQMASDEACQLVYEVLWSVAAADGRLDPNEDRMLLRLAGLLNLGSGLYHYYRKYFFATGARRPGNDHGGWRERSDTHRTSEQSLAKAYAKLGCSASDTDDAVRSAYRRQAMKYHPDRLRAEGLPDGMIQKATESMAEINAAWDLVRRTRGIG